MSKPKPTTSLADFESQQRQREFLFLKAALDRNGWALRPTARDLGASKSTLVHRIKRNTLLSALYRNHTSA